MISSITRDAKTIHGTHWQCTCYLVAATIWSVFHTENQATCTLEGEHARTRAHTNTLAAAARRKHKFSIFAQANNCTCAHASVATCAPTRTMHKHTCEHRSADKHTHTEIQRMQEIIEIVRQHSSLPTTRDAEVIRGTHWQSTCYLVAATMWAAFHTQSHTTITFQIKHTRTRAPTRTVLHALSNSRRPTIQSKALLIIALAHEICGKPTPHTRVCLASLGNKQQALVYVCVWCLQATAECNNMPCGMCMCARVNVCV